MKLFFPLIAVVPIISSSPTHASIVDTADHDVLQSPPRDKHFIVEFQPAGVWDGSEGSIAAEYLGDDNLYLPEIDAVALSLSQEEVMALEDDPRVKNIQVDEIVFLPDLGIGGGGDDESSGQQHLRRRLEERIPYGIPMVQADQVDFEPTPDDPTIRVCVIDSGYSPKHEDLPSNDKGFNVIGYEDGNLKWDKDGYGHGTHVAGTIAALKDNGLGVVGVAPGISLINVRVFGKFGLWAYTSDLIHAAYQCKNLGANVINISLGHDKPVEAERTAFDDLYNNHNILSIAAAGNDGNNEYSYPASYDSVISVAAIDHNKERAWFSQTNDQIELSAPGVNIESTFPNNRYAIFNGTSMATPHVAGVASIVWKKFNSCTNTQIREALTESAKDLGIIGRDNEYGYGLVQANDAVAYLTEMGLCDDDDDDVDDVDVDFDDETPSPPTPPPTSPITAPPTTPPPTPPPTTPEPQICGVKFTPCIEDSQCCKKCVGNKKKGLGKCN